MTTSSGTIMVCGPSCLQARVWRWEPLNYADESGRVFGRNTDLYGCHTTHSLWLWEWVSPCEDHPPSTSPPPPSSTHLPLKSHHACHLSPRPSEINNPRITSRPRPGPCQAFAFIALRTSEKERWGLAAIWGEENVGVWSRSRPDKGRSGRRTSHPWSVRQRSLLHNERVAGGGGGGRRARSTLDTVK